MKKEEDDFRSNNTFATAAYVFCIRNGIALASVDRCGTKNGHYNITYNVVFFTTFGKDVRENWKRYYIQNKKKLGIYNILTFFYD